MPIQALECPHCGAPISPSLSSVLVACAYCGYTLSGVPGASWGALLAATRDEDDDDDDNKNEDRTHDLAVLGRRYLLLGRLAQGESTDVYLGSRMGRVTERVVIKVLRALEDADLVLREWRILHALHASEARAAALFRGLLPQPVAKGTVDTGDGIARLALVYRWRSGFQHTARDIARVYPRGIDARAAVWIWRRVLELLSWVHETGHVHGAVLPEHMLVHPRDHGVVLCGWSCATALGAHERLPAWNEAARALYPSDVLAGAPPSPGTDIAMSARCIATLLGGDPRARDLPGKVPSKLAGLVRSEVDPRPGASGWALRERVGETAKELFGPPRYEKFEMPGWAS
jgi:hypothetical protein